MAGRVALGIPRLPAGRVVELAVELARRPAELLAGARLRVVAEAVVVALVRPPVGHRPVEPRRPLAALRPVVVVAVVELAA